MSQYNYIGVSLHGHFDNRLAVRFASTPDNVDKEAWISALPDPDAIIRNFMSARDCYVMWQNDIGHHFGFITNNPNDPHAGRVMITLMVRSGDAIAGTQVFRALNSLRKILLEDGVQTDEAVNQALRTADIPAEPMRLSTWTSKSPLVGSKPMCYRTFLSTRELETVFSFPNQADYQPYIYTIVISATTSVRPGITIDRITTPIKKRYAVICPDGASASAETVTEGEHLTINFTKDGFNPRKETITVGTPSPYVKYVGAALIVKAPHESGMGFVRRVRIAVKSAKGGLINGYTITVNDRPVNTMESYIELNEVDLRPGRKIDIQVASNNFHPLKLELNPNEIDPHSVLDLIMTPIEQGIVLRLDFGEGRVFEQQISIEKNTPEYSQLHSGNFHGFRAHRQAGPGEVYNIDVRAAGKPVAPAFENVADKQPKTTKINGPKAPVFENITDSKSSTSSTIQTPEITKDSDTKSSDSTERKPKSRVLALSAIILAAVIILAAIVLPRLRGASAEQEVTTADSIAAAEQTGMSSHEPDSATLALVGRVAQENAQQAQQANRAEIDADIAYLNENKVWKRADLKTPKYQALIDAIAAGDIQAMAENDYFSVEGQCTNKNALKLIGYAWAVYGTRSENANVQILKSFGEKDAINVFDLMDKLSRNQPLETNQNPRPKH